MNYYDFIICFWAWVSGGGYLFCRMFFVVMAAWAFRAGEDDEEWEDGLGED